MISREKLNSFESTEALRTEKQKMLDSIRMRRERNRLGQFATPFDLALDIAKAACEFLEPKEIIDFFEPSGGTGAFVSALLHTVDPARVRTAKSIEIDPEYANISRDLWSPFGIAVENTDLISFLKSPLSPKPNFILANPPYTRHHHIPSLEKKIYQELTAEACGLSPSGLSGLYIYFVILASSLLEKGGIAAWLLPSEFFDVNYGVALKKYLTNNVTLLRIHKFDSTDLQFEDALVSSCVVFLRNTKPVSNSQVLLTEGSIENPKLCAKLGINSLITNEKWSKYFRRFEHDNDDGVRLGEYFSVKRGVATGANDFFIMSRDRARELNLPEIFIKPVLPPPRNLESNIIESCDDGYPDLEQQMVLLDVTLPENILKISYPDVWAYLSSDEALSIKGRFLTSSRSPWYKQEQRLPPRFLLTYMGRGSSSKPPFRFILNRSRAIATNLYLFLYPKDEFVKSLLKSNKIETEVFDQLNRFSTEQFKAGGRVYGGGMHKLEPKEVANLFLPKNGLFTTSTLEMSLATLNSGALAPIN